MRIRIDKARREKLQAEHPGFSEWRAVEAASRQEVNDLRRAGYVWVVNIDGVDYWGKGR